MANREKGKEKKRKKMAYKTLLRKVKIEEHKHYKETMVLRKDR